MLNLISASLGRLGTIQPKRTIVTRSVQRTRRILKRSAEVF